LAIIFSSMPFLISINGLNIIFCPITLQFISNFCLVLLWFMCINLLN
jgi:hypothetical protein